MPIPPRDRRSSLLPSGFGLRLIAMLGALALIGATIHTLHKQFLDSQAAEKAAIERGDRQPPATEPKSAEPWKETIIAGANDTDPAEREEMQRFLEVVSDERPIEAVDSPAYLRMLKWAMTQPMADMESRANREITFAKLWKYPHQHRAELVRMRMQVKRVIHDQGDEVAANSFGLEEMYEIWTTTEDSNGNPFIIIVPELPPGIPVAHESHGDIVFSGYFLKIFGYEAADKKARGAPLLIGRLRKWGGSGNAKAVASARDAGLMTLILALGMVICVVILGVTLYRQIRGRKVRSLRLSSLPDPDATLNIEEWLERGAVEEPSPAANGQPHSAGAHSNGHFHNN